MADCACYNDGYDDGYDAGERDTEERLMSAGGLSACGVCLYWYPRRSARDARQLVREVEEYVYGTTRVGGG